MTRPEQFRGYLLVLSHRTKGIGLQHLPLGTLSITAGSGPNHSRGSYESRVMGN